MNRGKGKRMDTEKAVDAPSSSIIREHLGPFSLGVALSGFAVTELALKMTWVGGPAWRVVAGAFEAATVGGMADWFAIRALFREMKIPIIKIPIPHTNIIIKNRAKIRDGIIDLVENRLFTPSAINKRLEEFSASRHLLEKDQQDDEWLGLILPVLRDLLGKVVEALAGPEVVSYIQGILRDGIRTIDFSHPLGQWIKSSIQKKKHEVLLEHLFDAIDKVLQDKEAQKFVLRFLHGVEKEFSKGNWFRSLGLSVVLKVVDESDLATHLLKRAVATIHEARHNALHPLRRKLDAVLYDFASKLESGDPKVMAIVGTLTNQLAERAETSTWIRNMLRRFHRTLDHGLSESNSNLVEEIILFLNEQREELRNNQEIRSRFDAWVREKLIDISKKNKHEIGKIVKKSLDDMNEETLVNLIEKKVGSDLQYIRLNGAVVGGIVGAFLTILKIVIHG